HAGFSAPRLEARKRWRTLAGHTSRRVLCRVLLGPDAVVVRRRCDESLVDWRFNSFCAGGKAGPIGSTEWVHFRLVAGSPGDLGICSMASAAVAEQVGRGHAASAITAANFRIAKGLLVP